MGSGLPVQQQQQARHQRGAQHRRRTVHRLETHRHKRSCHREFLAAGDGELPPGMGYRARRQPPRHHGPDAGLRPRRPVARPGGLRSDDGAGDGNGLDDRTRRRPTGDPARRVRPDSRAARRLRRRCGAGDPRPGWRGNARRIGHGGVGPERGRRDGAGVLPQRDRNAPSREPGPGGNATRRLLLPG